MMAAASPPGDQGRDALGRFWKGNIFAKGNPFAKHAGALRKAFYDEATPEDLQQVARRLLNAAKGGDWVAAQVALRWLLGRPPDPVDPYALLLKAAALEVVHRAGQARRGQPAAPEESSRVEEDLPDLTAPLRAR
jgi:hypothetical protein